MQVSCIVLILLRVTISDGWSWSTTPTRLGVIAAVTLGFAAVGHLVRGVSRSGAVAGAIVCFVLLTSVGPGSFVALLAVFIMTSTTTRMGWARKQRLGTAERGEGRTASQVLANLGIATLCAFFYAIRNQAWLLLAMAAALAEAASDTVSSEVGQAFSEQARLITTSERVPAGTDGGITFAGTVAGTAAALGIGLVCWLTDVLPWRWLWIAGAAGALGMIADSYLGACFERAGKLGNNVVNLLSTAIAALLASCVVRLIS